MKVLVLTIVAVALAAGATVPSVAQVGSHFFPTRPKHVTLLFDSGKLMAYGAGNDTAGLAIRKPNGEEVAFFIAFPARANGKRVNVYSCTSKPLTCLPGIRKNKTRVRVTYWYQKAPWGTLVKVSDTIASSK